MLAGVDIGSTGLKVSVFRENGERIAFAYREYSLEYLGNDQVVINPEVWWQSFLSCIKELKDLDVLSGIAALGVSHANALVLADGHYTPVYKAVMQLDKRAAEEVQTIKRELGADKVLDITGNAIREGYTWGPTLKWLQKNEPEIYKKIRSVFNPASYLVMKLTGAYCMDHTRACTTSLYDIKNGTWSTELCCYFGIDPKDMPFLCKSDEIVGTVSGEAADAGLPKGIAVIAGAMDTVAAMIGLTSGRNNNALIMGSVGRFALIPNHADARFLNTVTFDQRSIISMTPVNNTGTALRWGRNLLYPERTDEDNRYSQMDALASKIPEGSEGLIFLPFLNGASCPDWDSSIRGGFLNIEAYHGPGHFCRAIMEGVSYALARNYFILQDEIGIEKGPVYCGGGGAKSTLWMQIIADIINCDLFIPQNLETETMGCAMLAGLSTGEIGQKDLEHWNCIRQTIQPDKNRGELYKEKFTAFSSAIELLKEASWLKSK